MSMHPIRRVADAALEGTIAGSFSSIGYRARRRLWHWEALDDYRLDEKVALLTGATSGLGFATARRLASMGARVVLHGRNPAKTERARQEIVELTGNDAVEIILADLGRFDDVRRLADELSDRHDHLDVLIHNAGALTHEYTKTADGMELTVESQVVAPFLLTGLLLPKLEVVEPSRVIFVSSGGMYSERLDVDALEMTADCYDGVKAYARAKRAQVVLAREWAKRVAPRRVVMHAMHPGWADTPGVEESLPGFYRAMRPVLRSPDEGADTIVWLAAAPEAVHSSGELWLDRHRRWAHKLPWTRSSDDEARRLWDFCVERSGWDLPSREGLRGLA